MLKWLLMCVHSHGQHSHCGSEGDEEGREVVCGNTQISARGRCTPDWCDPGRYCILSSYAPESRQTASFGVVAFS